MKKPYSVLALSALILTLSPSGVYAMNTCEAIFHVSANTQSDSQKTARPDDLETSLSSQAKAASYRAETLLIDHMAGKPESTSFIREGYALVSQAARKLVRVFGGKSIFETNGGVQIYDGRAYVEFPNSTSVTTRDKDGKLREFFLVRGVRDYKVGVNSKTGQIDPENYVSDVLLFERVNGVSIFRNTVLASAPEVNFKFEDPRISIVPDGRGGRKVILSGTDYSPHKPPFTSPDVMNRYVELDIDANGLIQPVVVDAKTKLPNFRNMSPEPQFRNGAWMEVDAKNATIAVNEDGQIVVRTRLRPNFLNRTVQLIVGQDKWDYAEQVFTFKDWNHFQSYNWNDALLDITGKTSKFPVASSVRPLIAKEIIRDKDLKENLKVKESSKNMVELRAGEKGMGPGTRPLRIRRVGNLLLASDGPGLPEAIHDILNEKEASNYPLADGDVQYITFDHEIRKFNEKAATGKFKRRHYTASIKFFDRTLTKMTDYFADAIQPKEENELGANSGILDLQHTYPMGFTIGNGVTYEKLDGYKEIPVRLERLNKDLRGILSEISIQQKLNSGLLNGGWRKDWALVKKVESYGGLERIEDLQAKVQSRIMALEKANEPFMKRITQGFIELDENFLAQYREAFEAAKRGDRRAQEQLLEIQKQALSFGRADIRVYAGTSDAHTAIYKFKVKDLIKEVKENTRRENGGQ